MCPRWRPFGQVPTTELLPGTECSLRLGLRVRTLCLLAYDVVDQAVAECIKLERRSQRVSHRQPCVCRNLHEDIRSDVKSIDVRTLVTHGDADRILPITAAGLRTAKLIKGARLLVVKDGPHCIPWRMQKK